MTDNSRRFIAQGSGFALAAVVATLLGTTSHAQAALPGQTANSIITVEDATKAVCVTNGQQSPVVNWDGGNVLRAEVRHPWPNP